MSEFGIPTMVHYPTPIHLQPVFDYLGYKLGAFPKAELAAERVVSLPMHPYLTESDLEKVIDAVKKSV